MDQQIGSYKHEERLMYYQSNSVQLSKYTRETTLKYSISGEAAASILKFF